MPEDNYIIVTNGSPFVMSDLCMNGTFPTADSIMCGHPFTIYGSNFGNDKGDDVVFYINEIMLPDTSMLSWEQDALTYLLPWDTNILYPGSVLGISNVFSHDSVQVYITDFENAPPVVTKENVSCSPRLANLTTVCTINYDYLDPENDPCESGYPKVSFYNLFGEAVPFSLPSTMSPAGENTYSFNFRLSDFSNTYTEELYIRIYVKAQSGNKALSSNYILIKGFTADFQPLTVPAAFYQDKTGKNFVQLRWMPLSSMLTIDASDFSHYELFLSNTENLFGMYTVSNISVDKYTITGLSPYDEYTAYLQAVDVAGNKSACRKILLDMLKAYSDIELVAVSSFSAYEDSIPVYNLIKDSRIFLYNEKGHIIYNHITDNDEKVFYIPKPEGMQSGVYFLKIIFSTAEVKFQKVVVFSD
jgi:hypothetical protein